MREKIDCFLPCDDVCAIADTLQVLRQSKTIQHINLLVTPDFAQHNEAPDNCSLLAVDSITSSESIAVMAGNTDADYVLLSLSATPFTLGMSALERLLRVAADSNAGMVYADHYAVSAGKTERHPVIDYQTGSVRDDFDFGQLVLLRASLLHDYVQQQQESALQWAAFYDLRLYISRKSSIFHINEFLYTRQETDTRRSGEKQFDYVNPRNRDVQVEMEQVVTHHLEQIGALVDTSEYAKIDYREQDFDVEASVVIPVFNRERTVADAVKSALEQKTTFKYNVIVVDNHSTDGTAEELIKRGIIEKSVEGRCEVSLYNDTKIHYYKNSENTGGSGGFKKAFELACEIECDYIWTMDDDVLPESDCLENLLKNIDDDYGVCIPNRTTGEFKDQVVISFNWKNPFKSVHKNK